MQLSLIYNWNHPLSTLPVLFNYNMPKFDLCVKERINEALSILPKDLKADMKQFMVDYHVL